MFVAENRPAQDTALTCRPPNSSVDPRSSTNICNTRRNALFIFSTLRTLFSAPNPQASHLHRVAHSFTSAKNITLAFPFTSALFLHSFAQERKSTPLLSCACARFCRNGGWGRKPTLRERKSPVRGAFAVSKYI